MEYPKSFNPHINKYVLAKALGVHPDTARKKIKEINDNLEAEGYSVFAGYVPISEVVKAFKTNRETLLYFWEQQTQKNDTNGN